MIIPYKDYIIISNNLNVYPIHIVYAYSQKRSWRIVINARYQKLKPIVINVIYIGNRNFKMLPIICNRLEKTTRCVKKMITNKLYTFETSWIGKICEHIQMQTIENSNILVYYNIHYWIKNEKIKEILHRAGFDPEDGFEMFQVFSYNGNIDAIGNKKITDYLIKHENYINIDDIIDNVFDRSQNQALEYLENFLHKRE